MEMPEPKPLWTAKEIEEAPAAHVKHPWNPESDLKVLPLSMLAGLRRLSISLGRIAPGKESFLYHSHERDEEFLYILSGHGRAEIDGEVHDVGPGDFMGFQAPGVAHHLTNPYDEELVYLMGGERSGLDVGYFPRHGRRVIFTPSGFAAIDDKDVMPMTLADYMAKPDLEQD